MCISIITTKVTPVQLMGIKHSIFENIFEKWSATFFTPYKLDLTFLLYLIIFVKKGICVPF